MKTMILYYSWSGTTAQAANLMQKVTDGDVVELKVANDTFSDNINETSNIAKKQRELDDLPTLMNKIPDLKGYDLILIGGPVWSGLVSTPVRSLLEQISEFKGTVIPFYTSVGSDQNYEDDFKKFGGKLKIEKGLRMTSYSSEKEEASKLKNWFNSYKE